MVAFHVLDDEVVRFAVAEDLGDISEPLLCKMLVDSVHDDDLLVDDDIRVVCHAVRDDILTFEEVDFMVVDTNIFDVGRDGHSTIFHNSSYLSSLKFRWGF